MTVRSLKVTHRRLLLHSQIVTLHFCFANVTIGLPSLEISEALSITTTSSTTN